MFRAIECISFIYDALKQGAQRFSFACVLCDTHFCDELGEISVAVFRKLNFFNDALMDFKIISR